MILFEKIASCSINTFGKIDGLMATLLELTKHFIANDAVTTLVLQEFVSPHYRRHCEARRPPRRIASDKDAEALAWWLKRNGGPPTAVLCIDRLDGSRLSVEGLRRLRGCIAYIDASVVPWYPQRAKESVTATLQALGELGDAVESLCLTWDRCYRHLDSTYDAIQDFLTIALSQLHGLRVIRGREYCTAGSLADMLRLTPHVKEVNINGSFLDKATPEAVDALAEVLQSLPLEVVAFPSSRMGDDAFARLAPALASASSTLTELDLSYCDLHDCSAPLLSSILVQCAALRVLRIEGNFLTVTSTLTAALNTLMQLRDFSYSYLTDAGAALGDLAGSLRFWPHIEAISYYGASFNGLAEFANALQLSPLKKLSLQNFAYGSLFVELSPLIEHLPLTLVELQLSSYDPESRNSNFIDLVPCFESSVHNIQRLEVNACFDNETETESVWRRLRAVIPDVDLGGHFWYD